MKKTTKSLFALAALSLAAVAHAGPPNSAAIKVTDKGFEPSTVTVAKGKEAALVFTRTTDATCAKEVAFPELKVKKELPLNTPVTVTIPAGEARTLAFTCGMGMYKSTVVVQLGGVALPPFPACPLPCFPVCPLARCPACPLPCLPVSPLPRLPEVSLAHRRRHRRALWAAGLALTLTGGCSSARAPADASSYTAPAGGAAPAESLAPLYDAVLSGARRAGREPVPDESLARVAAAMVRRIAEDPAHRQPAARIIQALAWREGVIEPVPESSLLRFSGPAPLEALASLAYDASRASPMNRVGVARGPVGDGTEAIVTVLSRRRLTFDAPVARRLEVGGALRLAGRLVDTARGPRLVLTKPDGSTDSKPLGAGPAFAAEVPLPAAGVYQIELVAEDGQGPSVFANFPVYVGVAPPPVPATAARSADAPESEAEAEATLFALTNQARQAAGRPPLEPLPALAKIARQHSADMAEHRFIAHVSPTTGAPADRVRRANLGAMYVLENLGAAANAREVHEGLMGSPGHRANILDASATHLGVGVVRDPAPGGGIIVTENFVALAVPIDVAAAPSRVLEAINRARAARRLPALRADASLAALAQRSAARFFQGKPKAEEVTARLNAEFSREAKGFRSARVLAAAVARLDDAVSPDDEAIFEAAATAVGVGVAQGTRPDVGTNALFVVLLFGHGK